MTNITGNPLVTDLLLVLQHVHDMFVDQSMIPHIPHDILPPPGLLQTIVQQRIARTVQTKPNATLYQNNYEMDIVGEAIVQELVTHAMDNLLSIRVAQDPSSKAAHTSTFQLQQMKKDRHKIISVLLKSNVSFPSFNLMKSSYFEVFALWNSISEFPRSSLGREVHLSGVANGGTRATENGDDTRATAYADGTPTKRPMMGAKQKTTRHDLPLSPDSKPLPRFAHQFESPLTVRTRASTPPSSSRRKNATTPNANSLHVRKTSTDIAIQLRATRSKRQTNNQQTSPDKHSNKQSPSRRKIGSSPTNKQRKTSRPPASPSFDELFSSFRAPAGALSPPPLNHQGSSIVKQQAAEIQSLKAALAAAERNHRELQRNHRELQRNHLLESTRIVDKIQQQAQHLQASARSTQEQKDHQINRFAYELELWKFLQTQHNEQASPDLQRLASSFSYKVVAGTSSLPQDLVQEIQQEVVARVERTLCHPATTGTLAATMNTPPAKSNTRSPNSSNLRADDVLVNMIDVVNDAQYQVVSVGCDGSTQTTTPAENGNTDALHDVVVCESSTQTTNTAELVCSEHGIPDSVDDAVTMDPSPTRPTRSMHNEEDSPSHTHTVDDEEALFQKLVTKLSQEYQLSSSRLLMDQPRTHESLVDRLAWLFHHSTLCLTERKTEKQRMSATAALQDYKPAIDEARAWLERISQTDVDIVHETRELASFVLTNAVCH